MLAADARCEGHTLKGGKLLGLCIACERRTDRAHERAGFTKAQAVRFPEAWACPIRVAADDGLAARAA